MNELGGILVIAHLTLHEARRRFIVLAALVFGTAFLAVFATGLFFVRRDFIASGSASLLQQQATFGFLTVAGLYAANSLAVMLAVLLPVDTLSGEIASGVIETLASKPVRRSDIVLGKWVAYWSLTAAYLVLIAGGVVVSARAIAGYVQPNIDRALPLMLLEATVLLTVSIAGGTHLSTVTNGIVAFGFYGLAFIGGWVEQIGALVGNQAARNIGIVVSLISPTDALWRLGAYHLQPAIVRDLQMTPFASASVPNLAMVLWAAAFTAITLTAALRAFERRTL